MSDAYLQNDPDRAGGLVSDAQGEFVEEEAGGPFDPRAFRKDTGDHPAGAEPRDAEVAERPDAPAAADRDPRPPMNDERMSSPGSEIDKAG